MKVYQFFCRNHLTMHLLCFVESPVLLDNVDLNHSVHPSCNIQFKYETKLELERQLQSYKVNFPMM